MKNIKLLIVDDHKMFLEGLHSILRSVSFLKTITTASHGEQALKLVDSIELDLIITDIDMPKIDGIELTKIVKERNPNIKIIAVSSHYNSQVITRAIKAGINGYLLKNTGKEELLTAITSVCGNTNYFSEDVKQIINDSLFNTKDRAVSKVKLSERETEILILISQEENTQEIAEALFISVNTVETHRKNLMRKIGTKNMIGLVKNAIQQDII
jgi:DNA-binding NarL/FixJ family response regulator